MYAAIAAVAIQAYGAIKQGQAAQKAGQYNAQVASNNAITLKQNADYALKAGEAKTEDVARRGRAIAGSLKAAQSANGVDVGSGSAADVEESQKDLGNLDTARELHNSVLTAYGYQTQATNQQAQAGLDEMEGSDALRAGYLKAAGGVLAGASYLTPASGGGNSAGFGKGIRWFDDNTEDFRGPYD